MEIIWGRFVDKTGGQKSRATVPLSRITRAVNEACHLHRKSPLDSRGHRSIAIGRTLLGTAVFCVSFYDGDKSLLFLKLSL
jgi:hypothetical protein